MCKFSLDFRKISCFISKNILSKVVLKYKISMLTCPSTVHPAYPKIHFRMRTVNPLSQLYINRKFQKYISVSICPCHRAYFMGSLFIGSAALISFYCVCVVSFYFSLFSFFFCGVYYLLRYGGKFNNTYNKAVKLFLGS